MLEFFPFQNVSWFYSFLKVKIMNFSQLYFCYYGENKKKRISSLYLSQKKLCQTEKIIL